MAWDILKNILFVGILYMVIPYLIATAIWAQIAKWRSDRDLPGGSRPPGDED